MLASCAQRPSARVIHTAVLYIQHMKRMIEYDMHDRPVDTSLNII